jgi:hypothetical protein
LGRLLGEDRLGNISLMKSWMGWGSKRQLKRSLSQESWMRFLVDFLLDGSRKGHSGGILVGIKEGMFEVEDNESGDFFVSMVLRNRITNHRWKLITVYEPAQHNLAREFIIELSQKCLRATLSVVLGGDFNLLRLREEKNNCNVNLRLMDKFNTFIDLHQLQEIRRCGPRYTWSNKQVNPIIVTLDIIMVSTDWEIKYPLCFSWSLTRVGYDHYPVVLDTGEHSEKKQIF